MGTAPRSWIVTDDFVHCRRSSFRDEIRGELVDGGRGTMEAKNLATLYDLPPLDWGRIEASLQVGLTQAPGTGGPDRHTCWLATIDADGRPHVTGVGAL